jgi:ribosomal protein S18 acetylase RimI-like enzyme
MPITLRAASDGDLPFARGLYLDNMREVSQRAGFAWDEARQTTGFDARFVAGEVSIVVLDGKDIGWVQIEERETDLFLKQLFVHPKHQRRGIGTGLLRDLIERARDSGKAVTLGVVKGNPARSLYERHGFRITREDYYKVYMAIESDTGQGASVNRVGGGSPGSRSATPLRSRTPSRPYRSGRNMTRPSGSAQAVM